MTKKKTALARISLSAVSKPLLQLPGPIKDKHKNMHPFQIVTEGDTSAIFQKKYLNSILTINSTHTISFRKPVWPQTWKRIENEGVKLPQPLQKMNDIVQKFFEQYFRTLKNMKNEKRIIYC